MVSANAADSAALLGVSVGSRCYVADKQRMWVPVVVEDVNTQQRKVTVRLEKLRNGDEDDDGDGGDNEEYETHNSERRVIDVDDKTVLPLQNTTFDGASPHLGCDDMIELNHLHEAAILYNLKKRFHKRLPYTYTGNICVALNPYQWLDELYSQDLHSQYLRAKSRKHLPPHVYAVAVSSYQHMQQFATNQSILVSGESGAGKTETTKIVMDNLASIAAGSRQETITKIIEVNPLLESFGNAKTTRNDNSSRFGKFTQLQFDAARVLCGAKCETYLLEKTRVITQEPGERNYHIFYQLVHGSSQKEKELFGLEGGVETFAYMRDDASSVVKDTKNFDKTKTALSLLGLTQPQQEALFQTISGILHLGQAAFETRADNEDASQLQMGSVEYSNLLLGLDATAMNTALCNRTMKAGGEVYAVPLSLEQAKSCRDALAKAIYSRVFDWMVARINASLSAEAIAEHTIGVLDIFGFESFEHNSYEQLCINYANEKLQQKFTQDVFKSVYDEYARENISWGHIEYADNQEVLALLESKMGVIALLNEEVVRPKGSEEGFVAKLQTQYRASKRVIEFARISKTQFTIHHYADSVKYEAVGFLEKHKDALLPDLSELMRSSSEAFLQELFAVKQEEPAAVVAAADQDGESPRPMARKRVGGGGSGDSGAALTVGTQFKLSLNTLMANINLTNVHYIRCIKPNSVKSTTLIDERMVVNQLRCAGVIEAISIARAGYPNRLLHAVFATEFDIFLTEKQQQSGETVQNCLALVKQFKLQTPQEFQMGKTKIYLQKGVLERLDHAKAAKLFDFAALIQSIWRGVQARRLYQKMRLALVVLQRRVKVFAAVMVFHRQKVAIATMQRVWRGHMGRSEFFRVLREDRVVHIQCCARQYLARRELAARQEAHRQEQARLRELERLRLIEEELQHRLLCEASAVMIQKCVRGFQARGLFFRLVRQAEEHKRREEAARRQVEEQEERERLRLVAEKQGERERQREEEQHQLALEQDEETARLVALQQAEEAEQQRQTELERQKETQAAVTVQKHARGRLARQNFETLQVESAAAATASSTITDDVDDLALAMEENARVRRQLEELLEANIELESLVSEWTCEREVLDASVNVKALDLKQRVGARKQQLATARAEFGTLSEQLLDKSSTMRSTETADSSTGSTGETETLNSSASEPEDDDEDWVQNSSHKGHNDSFDLDRPSTDVAHFLEKRSTLSKPRFSNVSLQQRKDKSAQLLRAGAKQLGMAKNWVKGKNGKAAKVHGEADASSLAL